MDIYGLIGKNISHSFSPDYFNEKFKKLGINAEYRLFELNDINEFPELITNNPEIKGLNVTSPFKKSLGQFMDFIDDPVDVTGTINTIKVERENNETYLSAYNTDIIGFEKTIKPILKNNDNNIRALILGSGGGSGAVSYVLRKYGILFFFISRKPLKLLHSSYSWIDQAEMEDKLLIINTTPLGMYPDVDNYPPIPYEYITEEHILYDLVYNPDETLFLKKGCERGATCINGLEMFKIQADESWKIWSM